MGQTYKVVSAVVHLGEELSDEVRKFEEEVQRAMDDRYHLIGGLSVVDVKWEPGGSPGTAYLFSQALTRKEVISAPNFIKAQEKVAKKEQSRKT